MTPAGFPHSDIPGSTPAYGSPRRIVVRHVLHRLLAPRHPPCALCSLTFPPPQTGCKLHRCFLRFPRFAIRFSRCKLPPGRADFHFAMTPAPPATGTRFQIRVPFRTGAMGWLHGGAKEIRTPDPLLARQVLSQLSYGPMPAKVQAMDGEKRDWWALVDSNH